MDYKFFADKLTGRNKNSRKLARNTYCIRHEDSISIRLHDTDIVTYYKSGRIVLNSGGWKSLTTKARLNEFSPLSISQKNGIWYVSKQGDWNNTVIFKDGMSYYRGKFGGYAKDDKKESNLRKQIRDYSKLVVSSLPLSQDFSGDCWNCKGIGGKEHLISHLKEGYVVPTLVKNALDANKCGHLWYDIAFNKAGGFGHLHQRVGSFVKRYLYRQLGLSA